MGIQKLIEAHVSRPVNIDSLKSSTAGYIDHASQSGLKAYEGCSFFWTQPSFSPASYFTAGTEKKNILQTASLYQNQNLMTQMFLPLSVYLNQDQEMKW